MPLPLLALAGKGKLIGYGLAALALLSLLGTLAWYRHEAKSQHARADQLQVDLDDTNLHWANDKKNWDANLKQAQADLKRMQEERDAADAAVTASLAKESILRVRLTTAERQLRESLANDATTRDWAAQRVPDAAIDQLLHAVSEALGDPGPGTHQDPVSGDQPSVTAAMPDVGPTLEGIGQWDAADGDRAQAH